MAASESEQNEHQHDHTANISVAEDNKVQHTSQNVPSVGEALRYGLQGTFANKGVWLVVMPVVVAAFGIMFAAATFATMAGVGSFVYDNSVGGLHSGNPVPFIVLSTIIVVFGVLLGSLVSSIVELAKIQHITEKYDLTVTSSISYPKGVFSKVYGAAMLVQGVSLVLFLPITLLNSGTHMVSPETSGTILGVAIALYAVLLLLTPILHYSVTIVADKALGNTALESVTPGNAILRTKDVMNLKKNYTKLFFYEMLFMLITGIAALTIIGLYIVSPIIVLARGYIYRSIVPDNEEPLLVEDPS